MPIIGVVGGESVQSILPDRDALLKKIEDAWKQAADKSIEKPPRKDDGSIDRPAQRQQLLQYVTDSLRGLIGPPSEHVEVIEDTGGVGELVSRLLAQIGDGGTVGGPPVIRIFLDP